MRKKVLYHSCGCPITIYKKGKSHKVLVCSRCGIVATNPLPLAAIAAAAPAVMQLAGGMMDKEDKKKSPSDNIVNKIIFDNKDKPNKSERYVQMALGGKYGR